MVQGMKKKGKDGQLAGAFVPSIGGKMGREKRAAFEQGSLGDGSWGIDGRWPIGKKKNDNSETTLLGRKNSFWKGRQGRETV